MKILTIIPARMSSGRFPGKPMAKIQGIPMVGHCYIRSKLSKLATDTYVAVCDKEVYDYITSIGGNAVMTSKDHVMCTDRVVEATNILEKEKNIKYDIIINVQGDQPLVYPEMIDEVLQPMTDDVSLHSASLMEEIKNDNEHDDSNRIKIAVSINNDLIYMSREPIPSRSKWDKKYNLPRYTHVALTAFRRDFMRIFEDLPMSPFEAVEAVDNLRVIENGYRMKMAITKRATETVDNLHDLEIVNKIMIDDQLFQTYKNEYT